MGASYRENIDEVVLAAPKVAKHVRIEVLVDPRCSIFITSPCSDVLDDIAKARSMLFGMVPHPKFRQYKPSMTVLVKQPAKQRYQLQYYDSAARHAGAADAILAKLEAIKSDDMYDIEVVVQGRDHIKTTVINLDFTFLLSTSNGPAGLECSGDTQWLHNCTHVPYKFDENGWTKVERSRRTGGFAWGISAATLCATHKLTLGSSMMAAVDRVEQALLQAYPMSSNHSTFFMQTQDLSGVLTYVKRDDMQPEWGSYRLQRGMQQETQPLQESQEEKEEGLEPGEVIDASQPDPRAADSDETQP